MRVPSEGSERLTAVFDARRAGVSHARTLVSDARAVVVRARPSGAPAAQGSEPSTIPLPVTPGSAPCPGRGRVSPVERLAASIRRVVPGGGFVARLDPGRPGATALALVAAAAALIAAVGVWSERPRAEPVDALPSVAVTTQTGAPAPTGAPTEPAAPATALVLSVVGKVRSPGLVEVPDGARVADAVAAAGGALPGVDLTGINLARRVGDGEQIAVGVTPAPDAGGAGPGAGSSGGTGAVAGPGGRTGGPVDLNRATADQLDTLPGVGPVTVERILEWRTRNGGFRRVEQLREIEGIGERRFGQLRGLVTVS